MTMVVESSGSLAPSEATIMTSAGWGQRNTPSPRLDDWKAARRILCVRLDAMGDVLMTSPAIEALRSAAESDHPRHITLLTSRSGTEAGKLLTCVDDIITVEVPWMKSGTATDDGRSIIALADKLRTGRFDAAVIFTVYSQNPLPAAMLCMMAGIPLRLAHCRENPYQLLTDWVREPEPAQTVRHEVRRQLDLVQHVVGRELPSQPMRIDVPVFISRHVRHLLETLGVSGDHLIVIHPGATAASRRYPPSSFAAVARQLYQETGLDIVFTGGAEEAELIGQIVAEAGVPYTSMAGRLSLTELAALIQMAPLVICNNTGPSHLSAAVETPVVCLYALTNPQHTPWMVQRRVLYHDVSCRNCYSSTCREGHHHCLTKVTPSQVVQAALQLLRKAEQEAEQENYHRNNIHSGELSTCIL
ncbi:MAG: lipopolysaccharide heptosyltransferase II [Candidatus Methylacidiphilales bacterium]